MSAQPTPRIVFLCTGNICRSPLAETIARQKFADTDLSFASAGLEAPAGRPASRLAAAWAAGRGLDLGDHASQAVGAGLLADAAWVIGMTRSHAAIFRSRWGRVYAGAIGVLGAPGVDLARRTHTPDDTVEVDDPFGQDQAAYVACGGLIDRLLDGWAATFGALTRLPTPGTGGEETT
jgi:protein-tyrosine-phosphatase